MNRAIGDGHRIAALFVADDRLLGGRWRSPNRLWFLMRSVAALEAALRERGAELTVLRGDPTALVPAFARALRATRVIVSRDHSPFGRGRDRAVEAILADIGIRFEAGRGLLAHEPEQVRRADGGGFAVFGPFHRAWSSLERRPVLGAPAAIRGAAGGAGGALEPVSPLVAFDDVRPSADPEAMPEPGEASARKRLAAWAGSTRLASYATDRDRLDRDGTSRLSQDLRFGLLSPVEVLERSTGEGPGPGRFATEIAWRDFYAHLLFREPRVLRSSFRREFDQIEWASDPTRFDAWRTGRTGFPIVDAALRQLVSTGWMHNRARMIAASFLTKDLLVDWRIGEGFFMEHLLDGDPASNNGGWQWAASTGTDPQPHFRVFNPALQGRRHDPDGAYVRRHVPELADVSTAEIHDPSPATRKATGYPPPIVDHAEARARAIAAYSAVSGSHRGS